MTDPGHPPYPVLLPEGDIPGVVVVPVLVGTKAIPLPPLLVGLPLVHNMASPKEGSSVITKVAFGTIATPPASKDSVLNCFGVARSS